MSVTAFRPATAITFLSVEQERQRFLAHCESLKDNVLVIDLLEVIHCDSAGIAFLIEMKRICNRLGRLSKITNMPASANALAEFYGIRELLND